MTAKLPHAGIISDADVLIDYAKSAVHVLQLISTHLCKLHVASPVLQEVDNLDTATATALGIAVVEPTLPQLVEASHISQVFRALSAQDALSFIMARDNGWACLTNDNALRNFSSANAVTCIWGLQLLHPLVTAAHLTKEEVLQIAQHISAQNTRITPAIIARLKRQLGL